MMVPATAPGMPPLAPMPAPVIAQHSGSLGAALDREIDTTVSHWLDADGGVLAQNVMDKHVRSSWRWK